jgi:hypothetical protein
MWIFMSSSFLSVVACRGKPEVLLVRGRVKGDIERVFPKAKVLVTPRGDYRFRAEVPAATVAKAIAGQIKSIEYDNFKNSVTEDDRHEAYMRIWSSMNNLQHARARQDP